MIFSAGREAANQRTESALVVVRDDGHYRGCPRNPSSHRERYDEAFHCCCCSCSHIYLDLPCLARSSKGKKVKAWGLGPGRRPADKETRGTGLSKMYIFAAQNGDVEVIGRFSEPSRGVSAQTEAMSVSL